MYVSIMYSRGQYGWKILSVPRKAPSFTAFVLNSVTVCLINAYVNINTYICRDFIHSFVNLIEMNGVRPNNDILKTTNL